MTNEQLVALIQDHIDESDNMLKLWENNQGFIYKIARRYSGHEELEDLLQVGYLGLCEAVNHYDAREGVQFLSYAAFWIRQAMQRHIWENTSDLRIPEYLQGYLSKYRRLLPEFKKRFGREPTRAEMRALLGVTWERLENIEKTAAAANTESLDAPLESAEEKLAVGDTVAAPEDLEGDMMNKVWQEELEAVIWPLVDALPEGQPAVIRARFQDGRTQEEAGQMLGADKSRARSLENSAMYHLRRPEALKQLRPFYEDIAMPKAYRGSYGTFSRTWTSSTERSAMKLIGL